jgi:large subunit ribosomal protein L5
MARLKDYYKQDVAPALMKKFSYKSVMQIPKLDKIVINVGAGEAKDNAKVIDAITTDLAAIRPEAGGLQGQKVRREL